MSNKVLDTKIKPQLVPFKCVVCNGFGTVNWGKAKCHACKGNGYILVPAKKEEEYGESQS